MRAPWILIWALAAMPVLAQGPEHDRGPAFDVILDFVDETTAQELQDSRDAIDALRDELMTLRDAQEPDEDAIAATREELGALRRDLRNQVRDEIQANEDLQAELRALAREAREDRIATVAAFREETFDAVLGAASDEQAATLADNREVIAGLVDELRTLRSDGATRDDVADLREDLRALQREQRDLVSDIISSNEDLRADLVANAREVRRDVRRDFRGSRDRFRRDRRDRLPGDVPTDQGG